MAGKDIIDRLLPYADRGWSWLWSIEDWNTPAGLLRRIFIFVGTAIVLLFAMRLALEQWLRLSAAWKKAGFPTRRSLQARIELRQREQFAKVLRSDLDTLAKAENWNDQFFTDLEADVEAEGGYYSTPLHRFFRRQSNGLRRVSSLIDAIESSTESGILLVGEPGSGKSVALRHLGRQMAERAINSSDLHAPLPLYLNLKEFTSSIRDSPTADDVKRFVLDNIRRGDADTSHYVNDHWDDYRQRGLWFFLFDSFDEIPAVLHAPSGSPAIKRYTEALRQFLQGMSACRGVIASREYKGPAALPWKKFRILPLTEIKQTELIGNYYLTPPQQKIVTAHVAQNSGTLPANPMFLALLCRYVKEEHRAPSHDHDLLASHIRRLAQRDQDYLRRHYELKPEELLRGATALAAAFAQRDSLGLAPTVDELESILDQKDIPGENLSNLLAALVDVKIGRSDVKESKPGDQRFTFAHRRYQESLFVNYIAANPNAISPHRLLTDLRWREYAVTLLQTQPATVLKGVLVEATDLLRRYVKEQKPIMVPSSYGGSVGYFDWDRDPVFHLLRLLQEGLIQRRNDIPPELSAAVEAVLRTRWNNGDSIDKAIVVENSGLCSESSISDLLIGSVYGGSRGMRNAAYRATKYLHKVPEELGEWFRQRLSDEAMRAGARFELLRLEALAAHLPKGVQADRVVKRARLLRSLLFPFVLVSELVAKAGRLHGATSGSRAKSRSSARMGQFRSSLNLQFTYAMSVCTFCTSSSLYSIMKSGWCMSRASGLCVAGGLLIGGILVGLLYLSRSSLDVKASIMRKGRRDFRFLVLGAILFLFGAAVYAIARLGFGRSHWALLFSGALPIAILVSGVLVKVNFAMTRYRKHLNAVLQNGSKRFPVPLNAVSFDELHYWIYRKPQSVVPTITEARALLRFLCEPPDSHRRGKLKKAPLVIAGWPRVCQNRVVATLEQKVDAHSVL